MHSCSKRETNSSASFGKFLAWRSRLILLGARAAIGQEASKTA